MPGKSNTENYRLQARILWPVFKPRTKFLGPALFYPLKQPLKLGSSTGESGGLPSMGSHRVGHDWSDLAAAAATCFTLGFLGGTSGKEHACQCRRHETWVRSLGQEDPLEEGMATHSSILAWRIPGTERSLVGYSPWSHRVRLDLACMYMLYFMRWHFKSGFL